jgi:predicted PurR-regulated permease PerM
MDNRTNWVRVAVSVLAVLAAAYVVWRVRGVIVTVLIALVAAYILRPLVSLLCGVKVPLWGRPRRLPRSVATGVVFVLLGLAAWSVWAVSADSVGRQIGEFRERWPDYRAAVVQYAAHLESYRQNLPPALRGTADSWMSSLGDSLSSGVKHSLGLTARGVGLLIELLLVPILAFYFLADGPNIRKQALFFIPRRYLAWTDHMLARSDDAFLRYIRGQVILCVIAFLVVTFGLWAIGVDFYLLLGLVAGITRAIPVIGPLVGAIPIGIVVLLTKSVGVAVWVVLFFSVLHILETKLLMPAILGRQLHLHPVLIIVALLIGAKVGGLVGMFLAAPVLAVVRTLVAEQREARQVEQPLASAAPSGGES